MIQTQPIKTFPVRLLAESTSSEGESLSEAFSSLKEKAARIGNDPGLEAEGQDERIPGKVQKKMGPVEKIWKVIATVRTLLGSNESFRSALLFLNLILPNAMELVLETHESRMAQLLSFCPFEKCDLGGNFRFDPYTLFHFFCGQALSPTRTTLLG